MPEKLAVSAGNKLKRVNKQKHKRAGKEAKPLITRTLVLLMNRSRSLYRFTASSHQHSVMVWRIQFAQFISHIYLLSFLFFFLVCFGYQIKSIFAPHRCANMTRYQLALAVSRPLTAPRTTSDDTCLLGCDEESDESELPRQIGCRQSPLFIYFFYPSSLSGVVTDAF